jgi:hypothetical protein
MKKIFFSLFLIFFISLFFFSNQINAQVTCEGTCYRNSSCEAIGMIPASGTCLYDDSVCCQTSFGVIQAPPGVAEFNAQAESGVGLILFFSNLIKLIAVIAGLWTMLNFILAGFTYVTSADNPSAIEKIGSKLTLSVVGLGIIIASYTIAAVIGLLLFGDATFIINPQIPTPLT